VFVTGLAINQHWIVLSPNYQALEALGHPWIIALAGIFYFLEFFADKIPWIDSAWDAVHTLVRPIGGALLAGGTSLVAHTAKASSRLVANSSPEPFSNIGLSLAEDAAVFGGLTLLHYNPLIALAIFAATIAAFLFFAPRILRAFKAKSWLAWKKLNGPANLNLPAQLPMTLPPR